MSLKNEWILAFSPWSASELQVDAINTATLTVKLSEPHFSLGKTRAGMMHISMSYLVPTHTVNSRATGSPDCTMVHSLRGPIQSWDFLIHMV